MPYQFTTPTLRVGYAGQMPATGVGLWRRLKIDVGQTVIKKDGFYSLLTNPDSDVWENADVAYLGGYTYIVSDAEAAALTAAGYGSGLIIIAASPNYGAGAYGTGPYGR